LRELQWLQDLSQINWDTLNNVKHKTGRHFRNRKKGYLKEKINELEAHSKNKNIRGVHRGINKFKKGCQPRTNLVKDENRFACTFPGLSE
jgi:hypothetical protein